MNSIKLLFTALFFLFYFQGNSQLNQADSLRVAIKDLPENESKVNSLISLSGSLLRTNTQLALQYATQAHGLAEKLEFKSGLGYSLKAIGMAYYFQGNYIETLIYWQQSLEVFQEIDDKQGVANMLNNLGAVNFNQGDDEKALNYYLESLKASEEIRDTLRIATALVNIGAVYFNKISSHDLALEYYLKALPLSEQLGDQDAIGTSAVNIGEIYPPVKTMILLWFTSKKDWRRTKSLKMEM
ncbi:MAG: tetratricopeptide repeat protein [Draconibacterium sp.]